MEPAVGVEAFGALAWLLAIGAAICLVMAGAAVWNGEAEDVPSGTAPQAPAAALVMWLSLAAVAIAGALALWAMMPEEEELVI